ncbi:MAG TPA: dual specificity protein phosphatase [Anaerolineales bacterium]|nr:dual specificity protein phosphatase [Anaerolineales bacterium]
MPHWITDQVAISGGAITPDNWHEIIDDLKITAVVNLRGEYQDIFTLPNPVAYLWLPVVDFTDPTPEQLLLGVQFIDTAVKANQRVLIHCKMGLGRSPTLAAAYLVWTGLSVDEAVHKVLSLTSYIFTRPVISHYTLDKFVAYVKDKPAND